MMRWGWLQQALEDWGLVSRPAPLKGSQRVIRVYLLDGGRRVLVGTVWEGDGEYVFRYSDEYRRRTDLPSLFAFPAKDQEYSAPTLWPFLMGRLPPVERPDIDRLLRDRNIDRNDTFKLLGELGKRTITSPYELELSEASRA